MSLLERLRNMFIETDETYKEDLSINRRASTVRDFYCGYPYFYAFDSAFKLPFTNYTSWVQAHDDMIIWCNTNCQCQWRQDFHRVIKDPNNPRNYCINEIGGGDILVFAFSSETDYTLFLLRWA